MNLHIKYTFIALVLVCMKACKKQVQTNSREQTVVTEKAVVESKNLREVSEQETLEHFLKRVRKVTQSNDDNDLKSIIMFPLIGHGTGEDDNSFKDSFTSIEELKHNPLIFNLFFKEYLSSAVEIESNKTLGKDWYYIKTNEVRYSFKLELINNKFSITEFEIPGA